MSTMRSSRLPGFFCFLFAAGLSLGQEQGGRIAAGMALFIFPFAIAVGALVNAVVRRLGLHF